MSGVKGRSGRKRDVRNIQKYFNEAFDLRSKELVEALIEKAQEGDIQSLVYVFDRRLGKPKQQTEITGGEKLGQGAILELLKVVQEERQYIEAPNVKQLLQAKDSMEHGY